MNSLIQNLQKVFKKQDEIVFAFLFGSQARGTTTPLSDVDIGVLINFQGLAKKNKKMPYGYEAYLLSEFSKKKINNIDLIILNNAPILLKHRCIQEGKLIYCKNEKFLIEFKIKTLYEYFDTQPLREKIRKAFYG